MNQDSSFRWYVLLFGLLFQTLSFGIVFYGFAVMLVPFQETFERSLGQIMVASLCLQVGLGLFSALLGPYIDRWPARLFVAAGGLSLALGFALCAVAGSYSVTLLVYSTLFPVGLVLAGSLAAQSLAVRWFPERRGFALGISAMGTSLGGLLMPPLLAQLSGDYGWQNAYFLLGAGCLALIAPVALFLLRRTPSAGPASEGVVSDANSRKWSAREMLVQPVFWVCVLGFSPVIATFTAIQMNIGAYASDSGFTQQQAAGLVSIIALVMIAGKLFFATLSDRLNHGLLFGVVVLGHIAVIVLLRMQLSYFELSLTMALFGFSVGGVLPLVGVFVAQAFGAASFAQAMGFLTPFVTASSALGPVVAASIRDDSGSYADAFSLFIYLLLPALLVVVGFFAFRRRTASC